MAVRTSGKKTTGKKTTSKKADPPKDPKPPAEKKHDVDGGGFSVRVSNILRRIDFETSKAVKRREEMQSASLALKSELELLTDSDPKKARKALTLYQVGHEVVYLASHIKRLRAQLSEVIQSADQQELFDVGYEIGVDRDKWNSSNVQV